MSLVIQIASFESDNKSPCRVPPNHASGIYLKKKIKYRAYPVTKNFKSMIVVKRQKKLSAIDQVDFRVPHQRNTYKKVELANW